MAVRPTLPSALWFLLPSLMGIFIFMVPVPDGEGSVTIPIAFLSGALGEAVEGAMPMVMLILLAVSAAGTGADMLLGPRFMERPILRTLFRTGPFWFVVRVLGLVFGVAIIFELGPEWLWGEHTGGLIFELAALLITVFLCAGLLLPLLLNFGLLDFAGALMNRVMRPLFKVPGRSSVDALASWLGDGTIGVLMTNQQYVQGHYTKREAAVLGTTFNVVSLTFTIVVIGQLALEHMFLQFYATVVVAGLVLAVIMPRIPPLSRFPDEYLEDAVVREPKEPSLRGTALGRAWSAALRQGGSVRAREIGARGTANVLEMWLAVVPIIMAVGTLAVIVAEHTPVFAWLGRPFVPLLELLQVPEANAASETMLIGFADMLLPAVIGAEITSEMTRFIIGTLTVTQLIFMSETGGMLLAAKIPVVFRHLVAIFLLRTVISLPVIVALAHVFF